METNKSIYFIDKNGHLKIKDNNKFLELLNGEVDTQVNTIYKNLESYAKKFLNAKYNLSFFSETDIYDVFTIALAKAIKDYDQKQKTGFLTYFSNKLRGEMGILIYQTNNDEQKVIKTVNENKDSYFFRNGENKEDLELIYVDSASGMGMSKILNENFYYRKLKSFRMAYSELPLFSQYVLARLTLDKYDIKDGEKTITKKENYIIEELAQQFNITSSKLKNIKLSALALILIKVLKSKYLTEAEKTNIKLIHDLIDEDEEEYIDEEIELKFNLIMKELNDMIFHYQEIMAQESEEIIIDEDNDFDFDLDDW